MKRNTLAAAAAALVLALMLTGCSPKETAVNMILKLATVMGFREEGGSDEEDTTDIYAPAGGDVVFPEGMDTESRFVTQVSGDTLYISFNGIANRRTPYFVAAGDSVTITSYAATESTGLLEYKAALWELSEDKTTTSYVPDSTVYFTTGGDCYTQTVSGLTPGRWYTVDISYDSNKYYITGGMAVQGVGSEELADVSASNG